MQPIPDYILASFNAVMEQEPVLATLQPVHSISDLAQCPVCNIQELLPLPQLLRPFPFDNPWRIV
jgi:hypothetical protein